MIRYGAVTRRMKPMPAQEIFRLHVNLLIIMTKAYLKGNPLGDFRKKAIIQSARYVFSEARTQSKQLMMENNAAQTGTKSLTRRIQEDQIFFQRIQLLAVGANAFAKGKAQGRHRKQAMADSIEWIRDHLAKQKSLADTLILKVA